MPRSDRSALCEKCSPSFISMKLLCWHSGVLTRRALAKEHRITGQINWTWRHQTMKQHSSRYFSVCLPIVKREDKMIDVRLKNPSSQLYKALCCALVSNMRSLPLTHRTNCCCGSHDFISRLPVSLLTCLPVSSPVCRSPHLSVSVLTRCLLWCSLFVCQVPD